MNHNFCEVMVEVTRGPLVESIHHGALAIADAHGNLLGSCGDPRLVANLRSSSKPFQALPLIERGGAEHFGMSDREIAVICASHMGTDDHFEVLQMLQSKIGVQESDLLCGVHPAGHTPTANAMRERGEAPTSNRHNCSGKHTGMLAHAVLRELPISDYLNPEHEIQKTIIQAFAEVLEIDSSEVLVGIDGCSAPTFAVPLLNAAMGFARLADPCAAGGRLSEKRAAALAQIARAMMAQPDMVAGPGGFDTVLMKVGAGKIVCKGGAEGYQAVGLLPGAMGPDSPALGITLKIADGDPSGRARTVVIVEVLRQLGALDETQLQALSLFGARRHSNWRGLDVGEIRTAFTLKTPTP
jgi:L-asparaginase II